MRTPFRKTQSRSSSTWVGASPAIGRMLPPSAFFCLLIMNSVASAAQLAVRLSYDEVHDRILPFAELTRTHVDVEATIDTSGAVQAKEDRASGKTPNNGTLS